MKLARLWRGGRMKDEGGRMKQRRRRLVRAALWPLPAGLCLLATSYSPLPFALHPSGEIPRRPPYGGLLGMTRRGGRRVVGFALCLLTSTFPARFLVVRRTADSSQ